MIQCMMTLNASYMTAIRSFVYNVIDEMSEYLDELRQLIIETYETNDQQPVVLIGHSMGNLYVQYLLKYLDPQWKKKYIKCFISLAGPWGGAVKTLRLMTSGNVYAFLIVFQCVKLNNSPGVAVTIMRACKLINLSSNWNRTVLSFCKSFLLYYLP